MRKLEPDTRKRVMSSIRSLHTKPELLLRRRLWSHGARYRVNYKINRTRVDIAFPKLRLAIFVDGCFWHGCPTHYRRPGGNREYWDAKLRRNLERDRRNDQAISELGWRIIRVWEHEIFEELDAVSLYVSKLIAIDDVHIMGAQ